MPSAWVAGMPAARPSSAEDEVPRGDPAD